MSNSKLIKFKGKEYGVALEWQEFVGKKNVVRNRIKDALKKKKHDGFGVKIEQDKGRVQVGFSNKASKGIPSLAKLLAGKEQFKNTLVLLSFDEDKFWMCGITKAGLIENGSDTLHDKEEFIISVNGYVTLLDDDSQFKIMIAESDADLMDSIIGDDIASFNVEIFNENENLIGSTKNDEIEQIYNASVDLVKQVATIALLGSVMASAYFFVFLEDPLYEKIVNQSLSEPFYENKISYENFVKKQDKELSNSYETNAKIELIEAHSSVYSNDELYSYIEELSYTFPIYLVEWELEDISYTDSNSEYFRVSYKRIDNSYGNTSELKSNIELIMKENNIKDYAYQNPSTKGDRLFINIRYKQKVLNDDNSLLSANNNTNEVNQKIDKFEKELKGLTSNIEGLENEVMSFSFIDKRFGSSLEDKEEEILNLVDGTARIYKQMKEERNKLNVNEVKMDLMLISGSKNEVLKMIQSYSYYNWKESNQTRNFPSIENKKKIKGEEIKVYAQSTALEVGDGGNLDIIGLEGLRNILLSKNLLNKPYIKVNNITFNLQTEEWDIKGEYYEKI